MSNTVINVENLGKRYTIAHERERYAALRDVITNGAKRLGRKLLSPITTHARNAGGFLGPQGREL